MYSSTLSKAGFRLKVVTTAPMAYMRLLHTYSKMHDVVPAENLDCMLVDIGHANVTISLFRDLRYDSARTIDFGCDEFDSIIAGLKGIDPYTAGSYKYSNFENVLDEPECLALCERFAVEVSKVVNFYNFNNPDREIEKLFFLGGGASIWQLTSAIADAVSVPASGAEDLLPPEVHGDPNAPACALAIAALLEGEAM